MNWNFDKVGVPSTYIKKKYDEEYLSSIKKDGPTKVQIKQRELRVILRISKVYLFCSLIEFLPITLIWCYYDAIDTPAHWNIYKLFNSVIFENIYIYIYTKVIYI